MSRFHSRRERGMLGEVVGVCRLGIRRSSWLCVIRLCILPRWMGIYTLCSRQSSTSWLVWIHKYEHNLGYMDTHSLGRWI